MEAAANNNRQGIPVARAGEILRDKRDLFDALQFNQFITPPRNDPLMTARFMLGVLDGRYWMPQAEQVKHVRACAYPPPRKTLVEMVCQELRSFTHDDAAVMLQIKRTVHHIHKKRPEPRWLLLVLA